MKTDSYFKVRRFAGGGEAWTVAEDIWPFCSRDRVSIEDAYAKALRRAEVAESSIVCVSKQPPFEGDWTECPSTTAPLPNAAAGFEDEDVPYHQQDMFGTQRVGVA